MKVYSTHMVDEHDEAVRLIETVASDAKRQLNKLAANPPPPLTPDQEQAWFALFGASTREEALKAMCPDLSPDEKVRRAAKLRSELGMHVITVSNLERTSHEARAEPCRRIFDNGRLIGRVVYRGLRKGSPDAAEFYQAEVKIAGMWCNLNSPQIDAEQAISILVNHSPMR